MQKNSRVETNYLPGIGEAKFSLGRLKKKTLGRVSLGLLMRGVVMVHMVDMILRVLSAIHIQTVHYAPTCLMAE